MMNSNFFQIRNSAGKMPE